MRTLIVVLLTLLIAVVSWDFVLPRLPPPAAPVPIPTPAPVIVHSQGPTIERLERLSHPVVTRVYVADVLVGEGEGCRGAWLIKGDALVGVNLGKARIAEKDEATKEALIVLPPPEVLQPRVDHQRSKTWEVRPRSEYADDKQRGFVTSCNMTDGSWQPVAERPWMCGSFVWTGFDYKGEPTPYQWPCINSHFGILDMCGFPKDNYYYYQSWWKPQPIVHLVPHWNWAGKQGQDIRVIVFSNCARVELLLNGQSLGTKEMPRNEHLQWTVKYAPGTLTAKGFDAHGQVAATDTVQTTGGAVALRLRTDRCTLSADGEDVAPVKVEILDGEGRVVPTADNLVTFQVRGAGSVAGVGNGNPSDHDPDQAPQRHAFNGLCMVVVRAGEQAGVIQLTATAPGLRPASLNLQATARKDAGSTPGCL
jgi:hypothetical protein